MVCRDARTNTARPVPPLLLTTPSETSLNRIGAEHKKRQKKEMMQGLDRVPPSGEEVKKLHGMMLGVGRAGIGKEAGEVGGEKVVYTEETQIGSVILMTPEDRNLHGMGERWTQALLCW